MMPQISSAVRGLMVVLLLLAGGQVASARGAAAATGVGVLCSGGIMVILPVDESGAPAAMAHLCPDAVLAFGEAATPPWRFVPVLGRSWKLDRAVECALLAAAVPYDVRQRGPPRSS